MERFRQVTKNLYRGSAPTIDEVKALQKKFNINKIVSLDHDSGEKISRACKLLGIKQIKIYIDESKSSLLKLFKYDFKKLLDSEPTFIHCAFGRDRTGLVIAIFQVKYLNYSPEKAIKEAKSLQFGEGLPSQILNIYENLIYNTKPIKSNDINSADSIVDIEREYKQDNKDSYLDEAQQQSFAPYTEQKDPVYNEIYDQSPTRQNYGIKPMINQTTNDFPSVGQSNNDSGITGAGNIIGDSGFLYTD